MKVKAFSVFLTAIPSSKVYVAIKIAVVTAIMKADLLNLLLVRKDIIKSPKQITRIPNNSK